MLGAKPGGTGKRHGTGTKVLIRISLGTFRAMKLEKTFCKDPAAEFQRTAAESAFSASLCFHAKLHAKVVFVFYTTAWELHPYEGMLLST